MAEGFLICATPKPDKKPLQKGELMKTKRIFRYVNRFFRKFRKRKAKKRKLPDFFAISIKLFIKTYYLYHSAKRFLKRTWPFKQLLRFEHNYIGILELCAEHPLERIESIKANN
jgi:hypothetical protein